jgi:hypothetical protein
MFECNYGHMTKHPTKNSDSRLELGTANHFAVSEDGYKAHTQVKGPPTGLYRIVKV